MKKLYFLLLTFLISAVSFGQELLQNGGFENWADPSTPTNFELFQSASQESSEIHSGTYAAKHTGGTTKLAQTVSGIVPGNSYTISLWYKVDSGFGDGTDARIWAFWRTGTTTIADNANELRGPNNAYFSNNGNVWTQYTVTLTAPATADNFYFEVRTYGTAVVYWDDFSFVKEAVTSPTLGITSPAPNSYLVGPDVDIDLSIQNFNVANGSGDGYIKYNLDGGSSIDRFSASSINLTGLSNGIHTVNAELVDNIGNSLSTPVTTSITFTVYEVQTLPYVESFNYTSMENLGDQNPWTNYFSGDEVIIQSGSLSYSTLNGNGNSISFDGAGIDPVINYTPVSNGKIYSSFILQVSAFATSPVNGYFAVLRTTTGDYGSRLWISPTSASTYRIGISNGATLTQVNTPTMDYSLGDTIFVVFNYDIDNNIVNAWINPMLGGTEPASEITEASGSTGNTFNQFLIRQSNVTETPSIIMDELRIGTTWSDVTPATLSTNQFETNNFKIYPNPTNLGYVNISSKNNALMNVSVFDILGKQVIKETLNNNRLNTSKLNAGIYIIKVAQDNATITKKLVIK